MGSAEDRQARALEDVARGVRELVKVQSALNENFVSFIRDMRGFTEKLNAAKNPPEA